MIVFPEDIPNRIATDIELAKDIPLKGNGDLNWEAAKGGASGISTIAWWKTGFMFPMVGMLDGSRLPRILLTEKWVCDIFATTEGIVTWNGAGFDLPVIRGACPPLAKVIDGKKSIDLMAIMALLKVGVEPEKLAKGTPTNWLAMAPRIGKNAHGWLNQGFSLQGVAQQTLGKAASKLPGFDGGKVIDAWQGGRYSEVASYNIGDAALTLALYCHAWEHGSLESPSQGVVEIPRALL